VQDVSLLNFVVSDGATMVATRFVRPEAEAAATLYYAEGASFHRLQPPPQQPGQAGAHGSEGGSKAHAAAASCAGCPAAAAGGTAGKEGAAACSTQEMVGSSVLCEASYGISYSERGASVAFVASEPITGSTTDWVRGCWGCVVVVVAVLLTRSWVGARPSCGAGACCAACCSRTGSDHALFRCCVCCARTTRTPWQVCVPKNTVLVVTREKGGFLSVLQSSLSTGAQPDPRLAEVRVQGAGCACFAAQLLASPCCSLAAAGKGDRHPHRLARVRVLLLCRCPRAWPLSRREYTPRAGRGWRAGSP
jgi:hypothetical protein